MKKITQNLRWLVTLLAMIVSVGAWAQQVTYDFTGSDWSVSNGVLTNGTVSFTGEGKGSKANFKMNNGYFMLGQNGAYINFPTYDFAVERIEVVGRDGASASVKQNIYVGDDAVSTETSGATGTNTYEIASAYQATGTQYTLKVTSAHNTQITAIKIYKKVNSNAELVSIAVSDYPANFYVGDIFSHEGAKVTATFSDNSTQEVTSQAEFTTPDMTSAGTKAVTVSYTRGDVTKTTSYDIVVSAVALESIAISGNYPKEFEQGNTFSYEGAVVTATYNNGSTQDVTANATFTTPDMSTVGTQTVSVSYTENDVTKETSYDITINEPFTPVDGVFDFTGTHDYGSGLSTTSDNQYYEEEDHTWTAGNVTLVTSGKYRWWNNANGNSLRLYDPSTLTLSVPEGNVITKVEIVGDNTNCLSTENGTYSNGVWTGASRTVVLSKSGDKKPYISSITVTYSNSGETPTPTPSITVDPATVNATAEEADGTLALSYNNLSITDRDDFGIQFYDANNVELTEEPDWVEVLVAEEEGGESYVVSYYMLANEGDARTAYCKVFAMGDEDFVYSNLITINQAAYVAPPTPVTDVVYKKVTSTDDITDGQYLIVYEEGSVAFNGGLATLDAAGNTIEVVLNDGTIKGSEETEAAEFTINVTEGSLKSASGKYIGVTSNSNGLKTSESSETYTNSFAIDDKGNAIISAVFEGSNMKLLFNNSGRFRYYSSINQTNKAIQLYKKVVKTAPSVTIGDSKWATYVAEDNVTFPSGVSAYTVETIQSDHVTLGEALAVKKGTPILVYSENPGTYTLEVVEEEDCDDTFNNKLKVSDGVTGDGATIYALANKDNVVGFYPVASNVIIPAGKAYLEIIESKAPVKGFFALGGVADAINNIAVEKANGTIFNIAGQKVQNITKGGLYIVNGKKVFVK